MKKYYFPFGEQLKKVEQKDRTSKKAFVLGVYASAVHARWIDMNGRQKVAALAVASEPYIFWTGEDVSKIIARINIPQELGKLTEPLDQKLNGPSGRALDDVFLKPLGLTRENTWLCDLLPESRVNKNQEKAIIKYYTTDVINRFNLCEASIPTFSKSELNSRERHKEILEELIASNAETLILLGDLPIYRFLRFFDKKYKRLVDFGDKKDSYGKGHEITINKRIYNVIPLCHPRQAQRLGSSSAKWGSFHDDWVKRNLMNKNNSL